MIGRIVDVSLRRPVAVLTITGLLVLASGFAVSRLELDALPDITGNHVTVLTSAPGFSPEEVELLVTRPIEAALGGMPGLMEQRSLSRYGISSVVAIFEDGVAPYLARQVVQERLIAVSGELPAGAERPTLGPYTGGLGEIFQFTLHSPLRTQSELYELAQLEVAPLLKTVSGVVEVNTWGGSVRTLDVVLDPIAMSARSLSLPEVAAELRNSIVNVPAATLLRGDAQSFVRYRALPDTAADLGDRILRSSLAGENPRVSEVARVEEGRQTRLGTATQNGRGETVYVMVQMTRDANALRVVNDVTNRMKDVRAVLPDDVGVDVVYDRSQLVKATLRTVFKNLGEGGLLVVTILFFLLGSVRAGLLVASSIPLSMLGALTGMVLLGIPGNLMSLGAIDFGLLVDGAVVMTESYFHEGHAEKSNQGFREQIKAVSLRMARPVFFSVLIILLVYVPILAMSGVDGKMFRPMAATVILALATSLILVLTYVPAASLLLLRRRDVPETEPHFMLWARKLYEPQLAWCVARPGTIGAGALALLVVGAVLFARAGTEFVPQLDEGDVVIQTNRSPDISVEASARAAQQMERALITNIPEVKRVASRIGSPAVATDIMGLEQADVFVNLHPPEAWRPGMTKAALVQEMESVLAQQDPGAEAGFTQPIQMRFNELIGGDPTDVSVSIYGSDLAVLRSLAEKVAALLKQQAGAEDVRILAPPELPLLDVAPNFLASRQAGVQVESIANSVAALRAGVPVGLTYEGRLRIPVRLRLDGSDQAERLESLPITTESGGLVPLRQVARVSSRMTPALVSHRNGSRRIVVGFNVRGRSLGDVVEAGQGSVDQAVALPSGYRVEWGGQFVTLAEAKARMAWVIPLTLLGILFVLALTFGSARPALLILLNVPFAGVGGMMALAMRGLPVSISAAVGFIALSGIAVLNGVVLMSQVLNLEKQGMSAADAVVSAARSRLRPVLMTALVAALGFLPMMLGHGVGAEVQRPLATVVVGGLATSTLLTLLILPSLYGWFGSRSTRATT